MPNNHDDAGDYHGLQVTHSPRDILRKPARHPGCKYYGNSNVVLRATGRLLMSGGNECAVIFEAFSPCKMEMAGAEPDESMCPLADRYKQSRKAKP